MIAAGNAYLCLTGHDGSTNSSLGCVRRVLTVHACFALPRSPAACGAFALLTATACSSCPRPYTHVDVRHHLVLCTRGVVSLAKQLNPHRYACIRSLHDAAINMLTGEDPGGLWAHMQLTRACVALIKRNSMPFRSMQGDNRTRCRRGQAGCSFHTEKRVCQS